VRDPVLVLHLARQLIERGRDADADRLFRQLQQQVILEGELARLAAEAAYRLRSYDRSAELARKATPATPAASGAGDCGYLLWYGQILSAAGRGEEALGVLRQARRLRPDLPDCWTALVGQLARMERVQEADKVLADLPAKMPADEVPLTRAVCLESLGRFALAEEQYALALGRQPFDARVLQRAASFFLRTNQPGRAEKMLRNLLDPTSLALDENLAWARRQLALVYAFRGTDADHAEAQSLLSANRRHGDDLADRRAAEMVRATRPRERLPALRALEALPRGPLAPEEQFWLAQLYDRSEQKEDWGKGREQMLDLLARDRHNPEYLAYHIRNLLRRGKKEEARTWITQLARLEGNSPRVRGFQGTR
jgi:Flp pilus assembly protein TadD